MFTDAAVDFVGRNTEGPFFLYLVYNTGLPPYQAPDLPPDRWDEGWEEKTASRATLIQMIEAMDAGIGRLLDEFDRRGLADDTIVIYTHDHGGGRLVRSDPLSHGFGTLWEGGIRVPLIVRWPGRVPAGTHRAGAAISMDVPATIREAVGVRSDADSLDGVDLLPLLRGEAGAADRSLFWFSPCQQAMRRGGWKYLRDGGRELLFDLQADIGEHNNVVRDHPELARELHAELSAWVELLPESKP
jgi:arylsulfatase A-like enzyme